MEYQGEPKPFNDRAARKAFNIPSYLAKNDEEYLEYLHNDMRPWWHEAKPRKKPVFKSTKLTNTLSRANKQRISGNRIERDWELYSAGDNSAMQKPA